MEDYYCTPGAASAQFYIRNNHAQSSPQTQSNNSNNNQSQHHNITNNSNSITSQQFFNKNTNNNNSKSILSNNLNEDPAILLRNNLRCNISNALNNTNNNNSSLTTNNECIIQNSSVNINYNSNNNNTNTIGLQEDSINNTDRASTASVIYAMDRLSPYAINGNQNSNLLSDNNNNLDCIKQQQQQQFSKQKQTNSNPNQSNSNNNNSSNKNFANESLILLNKNSYSKGPTLTELGNTSPTSSTSPSSSIDNPTYTSLSNSILNGTLTPPPDNGANSLNSEAIISANVYNPYAVKVESIQSIYDHQTGSQQHSHHHQQQPQGLKQNNNNNNNNLLQNTSLLDTTGQSSLISLGTNSTTAMLQTLQSDKSSTHQASTTTNLNHNTIGLNSMLQLGGPISSNGPMMSMLSPSRPQNISELSNSSMVSSSSGSSTTDPSSTTNKRARAQRTPSDQMQKDGKYFERRKRNNVAAKKSRDARKQREDEIAIRASFLEKENSILKAQLQTLKDEAQQLRILLSQKKSSSMNSGGGCANCSGMACSSNKLPVNQGASANNNNSNLGLMNTATSGYALNGLIAQTTQHHQFDIHHADPTSSTLLNLDKHQNQNAITSPNSSIYLQHQTQHRHQII